MPTILLAVALLAAAPAKSASLTVRFAKPTAIEGFLLLAGDTSSPKAFAAHAVPTEVSLLADGKRVGKYRLLFVRGDAPACPVTAHDKNLDPRMVVLRKQITARTLALRIDAAEGKGPPAVSGFLPLVPGAELKVGPLTYGAPMRALVSLRAGTVAAAFLSPDAQAEAVAPLPDDAALQPDEEWRAFLGARGIQVPEGIEAFLKALGPELLDRPVAVLADQDGRKLVGGLSYAFGDAPWIEVYPEIELDAEGRIAKLRRIVRSEKAAGCRETLALP
jgi:hypothetical protein